MHRIIFGVLIIASSLILSGCDATHLYLIKQPNAKIPRGMEWQCLSSVKAKILSGEDNITEEEKALFNGNDVKYFLWWGSLSGPKPVEDVDGYISEAKSIFPITDKYKINLTERYVLCLLNSGYMWPDAESVKKRFKQTNAQGVKN